MLLALIRIHYRQAFVGRTCVCVCVDVFPEFDLLGFCLGFLPRILDTTALLHEHFATISVTQKCLFHLCSPKTLFGQLRVELTSAIRMVNYHANLTVHMRRLRKIES